jgi:hypothetical protein
VEQNVLLSTFERRAKINSYNQLALNTGQFTVLDINSFSRFFLILL